MIVTSRRDRNSGDAKVAGTSRSPLLRLPMRPEFFRPSKNQELLAPAAPDCAWFKSIEQDIRRRARLEAECLAEFNQPAALSTYQRGKSVRTTRATAVRRKLSSKEGRVALVMALMLPIYTLFWIAQSQIWNTYNLWVRDHVDLAVGSWKMPVPWLQAVDALGVVVLLLPILQFWRWQASRSREPDDLTKLVIGCLLFGAAIAWLAAGPLAADATGKVPLVWALAYHFLSAVGYLYFAPVAVAVFSRTAPASINAMMIGVYYLSIFAGSTISGRLGGLYERLSSAQCWLIHAAIVVAGGLLILLFASRLRRELMPCPNRI